MYVSCRMCIQPTAFQSFRSKGRQSDCCRAAHGWLLQWFWSSKGTDTLPNLFAWIQCGCIQAAVICTPRNRLLMPRLFRWYWHWLTEWPGTLTACSLWILPLHVWLRWFLVHLFSETNGKQRQLALSDGNKAALSKGKVLMDISTQSSMNHTEPCLQTTGLVPTHSFIIKLSESQKSKMAAWLIIRDQDGHPGVLIPGVIISLQFQATCVFHHILSLVLFEIALFTISQISKLKIQLVSLVLMCNTVSISRPWPGRDFLSVQIC